MATMMKKTLAIFLALVLIGLLPFLGGSMIWYLGGADDLDINGSARQTDRPADSFSIGSGWPGIQLLHLEVSLFHQRL